MNTIKIVTKAEGECGTYDCPFFDSFVESGWGIVWRCSKGPVSDIAGAENNIPSYMDFCPHDPMAEVLYKVSRMDAGERLKFAEKIQKINGEIENL